MKMIRVLAVAPGEKPIVKEISNTLESLQKEVTGNIEVIYPFDDPVGIVCNEEGKLLGLPLNRALRTEDSEIYDILAGTFLVVGLGEEDFASLPNMLAEKYKERFRLPETFVWINGHVCAIPQEPEGE